MVPTTSPTPETLRAPAAVKRSAALYSVMVATGITLLKLVTGLLTGSLGMLSEAAHSTIDLVAAAITLFSVQVADRPADEEHNYGHGKVESLSAFIETCLMLASSVWIIYEAVTRILHRSRLLLPLSVWPFLVLLLSIAVDYTRARSLRRIAEEHHSDALAADAVHFGTDIYASAAVLLGLAATKLGEHLHLPTLELADPIAALVVAAIILKVSWSLARRTVDTLLDATPANTRSTLMAELGAIDGVVAVERLRTRRAGAGYFADVTLALPRTLTFQRSEQVTAAATRAIQRVLPEADVVVHPVPTATPAESIHDRVRVVAARENLSIHDVALHQHGNELNLELHLELPEALPLREAHDRVTRLESKIRTEVPRIASILTHIESEPATIEQPEALEQSRETAVLERVIRQTAMAFRRFLTCTISR